MLKSLETRSDRSPPTAQGGAPAAPVDGDRIAFSESSSVACAHCQLDVPPGFIVEGESQQFCCNGCRFAYQLIHENGLEAYYRMRDVAAWRPFSDRNQAADRVHRFEEFDSQQFTEDFVATDASGNHSLTFVIQGIHCAACVWLLEKLPQIVSGVHEARVNWSRGTIQVRWDPKQTALSTVALALDRLGYHPHPIRHGSEAVAADIENRKQLIRVAVAAAAAGNNMLVAAALYLGMFSHMSAGMESMLRLASCFVGLVSMFWPGRVFLWGAYNALKTRTSHMDLPIALGLTVGTTAGLVNVIRGTGEIYFDSISVLIFLLLVGRWIQFRQQRRAADSIEMLYRLTPRYARKRVDGVYVETLADLVNVDDQLEVLAGELFPVDGVIIAGRTTVDESILTGESREVARQSGDAISAGTINRLARVEMRTSAVGQDTRIAKLSQLVEQSAIRKPAVVQWANRIGGWFVVVVIALAGITLLLWMPFSPAAAIERCVSLLIVACPCALALATPLAIAVALGRLANRQILVKGGDVIERLNRPGTIWLDKTGTLTEGRTQVAEWHGDTSIQPLVAAIQSQSNHPVATAMSTAFGQQTAHGENGQRLTPSLVQQTDEGGITGQIGDRQLVIGNQSFVAAHGVEIDEQWKQLAAGILRRGWSPCWVAEQGRVAAIAGMGDAIRRSAGPAVEELRSMGWNVGILSGDHQVIVDRVAEHLGIAPHMAHGGLTPEDKVEWISQGNQQETVVMVGDGVNDSASMAAASVGVAVHNSAEASLAAAPVYLARPGLGSLLGLLHASRQSCRVIKTNFAISLSYNALGASLAMMGVINPLVAAILMPISSLTVVSVSLRAGRFPRSEGPVDR